MLGIRKSKKNVIHHTYNKSNCYKGNDDKTREKTNTKELFNLSVFHLRARTYCTSTQEPTLNAFFAIFIHAVSA